MNQRTVLLAEDDEAIRNLMASVLEQSGYRVIAAENAGHAIVAASAHEGTIDLLLTDVVMPDIAGPELAKRLRAEHPQLKVLFVSGYGAEHLGDSGVLAENERLLPKPFPIDQLTVAVREALGE